MSNVQRRTSPPHHSQTVALLVAVAVLIAAGATAVADEQGFVTFNGLPVPGATITAIQGDRKIVATSDEDGRYELSGLGEGSYALRVEMLGFATLTREVPPAVENAPTLELSLLPFEEIRKNATIARPIIIETLSVEEPGASEEPVPIDPELERQAAEGLLVNGSVNNAAASPFAQARGFGNNRPGQRSLYNGGFGFSLGASALDARPFSFAGARVPKPDYTDSQFAASFGGPFRIPGVRNRPVFFAGYQHSGDHNALTQSAVVPTLKQRSGDFSGAGEIRDPETGRAFPGNVISASRISPQAAALVALYPAPNVDAERLVQLSGDDRFEYEPG